MEEVLWRAVIGYEGLYEVSNLGEIRSVPKQGFRKYCIKKTKVDFTTGYIQVQLSKNNVPLKKRVHVIVAKAHVPNPFNLPILNHKDGIKSHNWASNLEWSTYSQNTLHSYSMGLQEIKFGDDVYITKIPDSEIPVIIEALHEGKTNKEIATIYGVNPSQISRLRNGRRRKNHEISSSVRYKTLEERFKNREEEILSLLKQGYSDLKIETLTGLSRKSKYLKKLKDDIC